MCLKSSSAAEEIQPTLMLLPSMVNLEISTIVAAGTARIQVESGKTYLLRMVNAAMNNIAFFSVANHSLTVVGADGAYTKPLTSIYITISPGQTINILLEANQPRNYYYIASKLFNAQSGSSFDNTTTIAIVEYTRNYTATSLP
uniref:Putative laccase-9 n=1 Tax=Tanacetum cinerariifolium TaxID=118510 RepID=A0A6L2JWS6_TANCI|nr:putative laccase-9 [Tanacetum cinerariifolium]